MFDKIFLLKRNSPNDNLSYLDSNVNTFDDRITPFIPGQPWAGTGQSSIDQLDPNCTPGSVAKSLLNDIDPESILSSLQHKSSWPDTSTTNTSAMTTNNSSSRQARGSWSSGSFNSPQPTQASSSIGETLWGVRAMNGNNNAGNNNTNSNRMQFNSNQSNNGQRNNVNMANNQQFLRSNSWNLTPQQQQQQTQPGGDRSWNNQSQFSNPSNGHYILLRNVPQQVS
jgi:hypothetical protein